MRIGESSTLIVREDNSQNRGRIRTIHSTGIHHKPPPSSIINGRIYSMEAALSGPDHSHPYIPDGSQILTEWRLLERRLLEADRKGKSKEIDNGYAIPDFLPESTTRLDPQFFNENERPSHTFTLEHEGLEESLVTDESDQRDEKIIFKPLWTASVDQNTMRTCIQNALDEVRKGISDIDSLATKMLRSIEKTEEAKTDTSSIPRCLRKEELRMLLMSAWTSVASRKIDSMQSQNVPVYLFMTKEMYLSTVSVAELAKGVDQEYARSVMAIQRATLFRLFGAILHLLRSEFAANPKLRIDALLLCAKVARDPRLRSAQARYMTRKILSCLRVWVDKEDECISLPRLWHGLRDMFFDLMDKRVIQSPLQSKGGLAQSDVKSEMTNPITYFMLCCSKTIGKRLGPKALAQHTLVAIAQRASATKMGNSASEEKVTFASTSKEVEMMIAELMRGNDPRTAYQLHSLTPLMLRSVDSICRLIRHYGNAPLCFSARPSDFQDSKRGSGRTSRVLMAEIASKLNQLRDAEYEDCLRVLAHARFAYCADRGLAGRAMAELRSFVEVMGGKSQNETLIELGEPAYCHFVRSLALGKRWSSAKEYATRLIKFQTTSGALVLDKNNRVNLLNVLLHSYLWPNTSAQNADLSRWSKTWNALSFVKNFCEEKEIVPNEKSTEYFITSFRQCSHEMMSKNVLNKLTSMDEWDWQKKGVAEVLQRIEAIVQAGGGEEGCENVKKDL
ncbi:hypothetical protein L7F22_003141 [Adiantum nelumboides]|nr:hypothetical protein [Adiantum nelumboides]